jgi:hypothetical protein
MNNYIKFRGKCKELCEEACKTDSTLTLVRGHYWCPIWNSMEQHWWTIRKDGTIYDPTCKQFPSEGNGTYIPFDGIVGCSECGKEMKEEEVNCSDGNYAFCSYSCYGRFVGVY